MANMGFEKQQFRRKYGNVPVSAYVDDVVVHFKSKLEYRWANHLELLKRAGEIKGWEYEGHTFRFDNIGLTKWIVDFVIRNNDDTFEYHECKGMLGKRDIDKLKCLNKDRPEVEITYIFAQKPKISVLKKEQLERYCKRVITNANTICKKEPRFF